MERWWEQELVSDHTLDLSSEMAGGDRRRRWCCRCCEVASTSTLTLSSGLSESLSLLGRRHWYNELNPLLQWYPKEKDIFNYRKGLFKSLDLSSTLWNMNGSFPCLWTVETLLSGLLFSSSLILPGNPGSNSLFP